MKLPVHLDMEAIYAAHAWNMKVPGLHEKMTISARNVYPGIRTSGGWLEWHFYW